MRRRVRKVERTFRSYAYLQIAGWHALKLANDSENGRFYNLITAMLFAAFALEAYLNHLGQQKIPFWDILKEKLRPEEKLQVLCKLIGYDADQSQRPFQTFGPIFRFRNHVVHAQTEHLAHEGGQVLEDGQRPPAPLARWEKSVTLKNAQQFHDDTRAMITGLHSRAGLIEDPLFVPEEMYSETEYLQSNM